MEDVSLIQYEQCLDGTASGNGSSKAEDGTPQVPPAVQIVAPTNVTVILECYSRNTSSEKPSAPQNSYNVEKTETKVDWQRKTLM